MNCKKLNDDLLILKELVSRYESYCIPAIERIAEKECLHHLNNSISPRNLDNSYETGLYILKLMGFDSTIKLNESVFNTYIDINIPLHENIVNTITNLKRDIEDIRKNDPDDRGEYYNLINNIEKLKSDVKTFSTRYLPIANSLRHTPYISSEDLDLLNTHLEFYNDAKYFLHKYMHLDITEDVDINPDTVTRFKTNDSEDEISVILNNHITFIQDAIQLIDTMQTEYFKEPIKNS